MPYGFGFNSKKFNYPANRFIEGKGLRNLPEYDAWCRMFGRCYNSKDIQKRPSYVGCSVENSWMDYQEFAHFWITDPYRKQGWQLDKDIIVRDNKIYGPETCCFVPLELNCLLTNRKRHRGDTPIGTTIQNGFYFTQCSNGSGKQVYLGQYKTAEEGFIVYKDFKESVIKDRAEKWKSQINPLVYEALINWEIRISD